MTEDPVQVVLVANFTADSESSNNRFNDLANRLAKQGAVVELVTSSFSHRFLAPKQYGLGDTAYKVTHVAEPGYSKNVSVRRLASQFIFSRRVAKYLQSRPVAPDVVYCAVPPPELGRVSALYSRKVGASFVVDIQDLWPEAFRMVAGGVDLTRTLFKRMVRSSTLAYRAADLVVGVSQTYVESAVNAVSRQLRTRVAYLGTDLAAFDVVAGSASSTAPRMLPQLVYIGTLSHSYDLPLVMDALNHLVSKRPDLRDLELVVMGDGPKRQEYEDHAKSIRARVTFKGRLPYRDMIQELQGCDIAVNPIKSGSAASVINKVCDYAAAGLPVINTQDSEEYMGLLEAYDAGINCPPGDTESVASAMERLVDSQQLRLRMGRGNRRMAEKLFDRAKSYEEIVDSVLDLARKRRISREMDVL